MKTMTCDPLIVVLPVGPTPQHEPHARPLAAAETEIDPVSRLGVREIERIRQAAQPEPQPSLRQSPPAQSDEQQHQTDAQNDRAHGELRGELPPPAPATMAVALVEGWRGEVCHVALTDTAGRFRRYKLIDPSFHNWTGLALALRGTAISDFPICNKSFNLSYCGFDL